MSLEVNLDLIKKYNKPGPRYTSYPTAPHFTESVGQDIWNEHIRLNNKNGDRDLSLYYHLPFCDTLCWFCGCTVIITRKRENIEAYLNYLFREIDLIKERLHLDRKVTQIHFGGGTPTYLSPDQIRRLGEKLKQSFQFANDIEIGSEMDPRGLTEEHIQALAEAGFNRASMGVQDFNPTVQKAVNRINSFEMVAQVIEWIRTHNFQSLNLDLIYGLPHQTRSSFEKTIDKILKLNPDRLAVFNYAHVPWMKPHQKLIKDEDLPTPEEKLMMLKMIIERLTSAGYVYIGMDHFAKEDDELTIAQKNKSLQRNFQGYSTKSGADIYAMGMSSISQLDGIYAQNYKELPTYYDRINANQLPIEKGYVLSEDDKIRRDTIMHLMCDLELDFTKLSKKLGIDFTQYYRDSLNRLTEFEQDGLLIREADKITMTDTGRLFIRNVAMEFDSYLEKSKMRYSKTV
ncbi:MAG: oxygen-independent coproporphyrinogen III oxidase [Candidatus Marinimicrobia bacterium]|nr:oxygen-independent coproporphyrinogen III oxidase [Candidatus Neomarinimicrobiota bacterium]